MILSWMLYGSAVAFLFGVAAASLESVVRQRGWPVRALWTGSIIGSIALPAVPLLLFPLIHRWRGAGASEPALAIEETANWLDPLTVRVPAPAIDLDTWLLAGWSAVSLALLGALSLSSMALERRRRGWRSSQVEGHDVWISTDTGPAVVGFLRSRIVLPEWIADGPPTERALAMAHESEHIRAGDPRLIFSTGLLLTALPWNPALWWQWRRLRQAVEIDCDLRVIARGFDPWAYGRLLVNVSKHGVAHRLAVAALTESPSHLERRIRLMFASQPRRWGVRAAGAAVVATLSILAACWAERPTSIPGPNGSAELGEGVVVPEIEEPEFRYEVAHLSRAATLSNPQEVAIEEPEFRYEVAHLSRAATLSNAQGAAIEELEKVPRLTEDTASGLGRTDGRIERSLWVRYVITPEGELDPASIQVVRGRQEDLRPSMLEGIKRRGLQPGPYMSVFYPTASTGERLYPTTSTGESPGESTR